MNWHDFIEPGIIVGLVIGALGITARYLGKRFDEIEKRFEKIEERFAAIDLELKEIKTELTRLDKRMSQQEVWIGVILQGLEIRLVKAKGED